MTDIVPIRVHVRIRSGRSDIRALPVTLNIYMPFPTLGPEGEGTVIGTGKTGIRLRLRTPAGWIPVPLGGDNDNNIKSFNVYDKDNDRWLMANWLQDWFYGNDQPFQVRAPGRVWDNRSKLNPNYYNGRQYITLKTNEDYIRLFNMGVRNNPHYRILILHGGTHLNKKPHEQVYSTDFTTFKPWGTGASFEQRGSSPGQPLPLPQVKGVTLLKYDPPQFDPLHPYGNAVGIANPGNFEVDDRIISGYQYRLNSGSTFPGTSFDHRDNYVGMIDLESIRSQLTTLWPTSMFYQGAYDHMNKMKVKRITVAGQLMFYLFHASNYIGNAPTQLSGPFLTEQAPELASYFEQVRFQLKYVRGADKEKVALAPFGPGYAVTGEATDNDAVLVADQTGIPGPSIPMEAGGLYGYSTLETEDRRRHGYRRQFSRYIQFTIEDPGEGQVAFYMNHQYLPGLQTTSIGANNGSPISVGYPDRVYGFAAFLPSYNVVHFVTPGHDVPSAYLSPDTGTGVYVMEDPA